ncbi:MAG: DnaJ domain-containing protein [Bdellovibrio sp.]|nr:DnaJ domain-containing protein [Bdellovibrio sp.]
MLKTELIIRGVISLFLVFIVGKVLAVMLQSLFNRISIGKSKRPHDLNRMIERQKDILRAKSGFSGQASQSHAEATPHRSATEMAYQNLLLKGGDQSGTKKMLELFDHLQWGDGKLYAQLQQRMQQRWCIRCEAQDVGRSLKWIVDHDLLLKLNTKTLPGFEESINLIEFHLFLAHLAQSIDTGSSPMVDFQSQQTHYRAHSLVKSMDLVWAIMLGKNEKESLATILKTGQMNKGSASRGLDALFIQLFVPKRQEEFGGPERLLNKIREWAFVFDALIPIAPINGNKDLQGALRIFGLKKMSSMEEIRKIYKDLANRKHPDKLMSRGVPTQWLKIANENFTNIQMAYDVLQSQKG